MSVSPRFRPFLLLTGAVLFLNLYATACGRSEPVREDEASAQFTHAPAPPRQSGQLVDAPTVGDSAEPASDNTLQEPNALTSASGVILIYEVDDFGGERPRPSRLPTDLPHKVDPILVPSYLPYEMSLSKSEVLHDGSSVMSLYHRTDVALTIMQGLFAWQSVKRGSVERVSVGGRSGFFVRGSEYLDGWDPDFGIWVIFDSGNGFAMLRARFIEPNAMSRAELLRVAESLVPEKSGHLTTRQSLPDSPVEQPDGGAGRWSGPMPNASDMIAAAGSYLSRRYVPEELAKMSTRLGGLLVPSYLPAGFAVDTTWNDNNGVLYLKYMRDGLRLSVAQADHDAWPFMKRGHAQPVTVGDRPGLLVRGGYLEALGAPRVEDSTAWWRDNSKMWLVFQRGSRWVSVRTYGGLAPLPDIELIRVAESLAPYESGLGSP